MSEKTEDLLPVGVSNGFYGIYVYSDFATADGRCKQTLAQKSNLKVRDTVAHALN